MVAIRLGTRRGTGIHLRQGDLEAASRVPARANHAAASRVPVSAGPGERRPRTPRARPPPIPPSLAWPASRQAPSRVLARGATPRNPDSLSGMSTLVLLRHGESAWNAEGLFTGWVDVGLSDAGAREAVAGGALLREHGLRPEIVHTSVLTRAIQTANLALEEAGLLWLPVARSWRLNERHYGALQGKNKAQTREEFGEEQFMVWRRSYDVPPPPLPRTECLADVLHRMLPYWYDAIVPDLAANRTVLVAAHGNSLRALVKHLDEIGDAEIAGLNIPTGIPLVYELDESFRPKVPGGRYLDPAAAAKAAEAVRNQGR